MAESRVGMGSALSIGIGGMVGGGIFAVTGLAVRLTHGAAPLAFLVAGLVALVTAYSYSRLSLHLPSRGGTVAFVNQAFGTGLLTGTLNVLLCLSYVVMLSIYAYAFGAYAAYVFPEADRDFWLHAFITGVVVVLTLVNAFGAELAIRFENLFNAGVLVLLGVFIAGGLTSPATWSNLAPATWVEPAALVSSAMVIFLNYEGFELIANASEDVVDAPRTLPVAFLGSVGICLVGYASIAAVVVGHLGVAGAVHDSDHALSAAAATFMGRPGKHMIVLAALLATTSAINATFYGAGRLTYLIARSGELPAELERSIRDQPLEGMLLFAVLTLLLANLVPLEAIATMGSAGFLLVFAAVNAANVRLARATRSRRWLSALGVVACLGALGALFAHVLRSPTTAWHLWILLAMIAGSFVIEVAYRAATGRRIALPAPVTDEPRLAGPAASG